MLEICLASALTDPPGALLDQARRLWPALTRRFGAVAVHVTSDSHDAWFELLESNGVPCQVSPPDGDSVGEHRRRALEVALANGAPRFLFHADLQWILPWLETAPTDLDRALRHMARWDCMVVGRAAPVWNSLPARLRETESLANHAVSLLTGRSWDLMTAIRGLSRHAAQLIVDACDERTVGSDVTWPLLCEINGLSLGYCEADGAASRADPAELDVDPTAWALEVRRASQRLEAMAPYVDFYRTLQSPDVGGVMAAGNRG